MFRQRQEISFPLADGLCWLVAARQFVLDVNEMSQWNPSASEAKDDVGPSLQFYEDLCQVQSARAAGEAARICTELVFGYGVRDEKGNGGPVAPGDVSGFHQLRAKVDTHLAGSQLAKSRAAEVVARIAIPEALDYPRRG